MEEGASSSAPPAPVKVEYDPVTGVPAEFNEFLPKDSPEYQKWAALKEGKKEEAPDAETPDISKLDIKEDKKKGKQPKERPELLIDTQTRSKRKHVTTIIGLEHFGVKLSDAAKIFGKKFACGASVTRNASEKDQIEIQGDVLEGLVDLVLKQYGVANGVKKRDIYFMNNKKKEAYFDE